MKIFSQSLCLLCVIFLGACTPKITTTLYNSTPPLQPEAEIIVLDPPYPIPLHAKHVGQIKIGDSGFTSNCGYDTIIDLAKQAARKAGANIIKLTQLKKPGEGRSCYHIKAELMYDQDPSQLGEKVRRQHDSIRLVDPTYELSYAYAPHEEDYILKEASDRTKEPGKAIIYGSIVHRKGIWSGTFPQYLRLLNRETYEVVAFLTRPLRSAKKKTQFCLEIVPGEYELLNYQWSVFQIIETLYTEPIYKDVDASTGFVERIKAGVLKLKDLQRYVLKIESDSVYYMGTWNFDTGLSSFTNDKMETDLQLAKEYKNIDFAKAVTVLPK